MENMYPPRPSSTITPKHKKLGSDEQFVNPPQRYSRDKIGEVNKSENFDDKPYLSNKHDSKIDDQFRNILERTNQAKSYIETLEKTNDKKRLKDQFDLLSPPSTEIQYRSQVYNPPTTDRRILEDSTVDNQTLSKPLRTTDFQPSKYETADNYSKLEKELLELKQTILTRFGPKDDLLVTAELKRDKSTKSKKAKFDLQIETSEDSDDHKNIKTKPSTTKSTTTVRSIKSPPKLSTLSSPKGTSRLVSPNSTRTRSTKRNEKTVDDLKNELKENEKTQNEKYVALKLKCKELKDILREYVNKNNALEDGNKTKDELIRELEAQLQRAQTESLRQSEIIQELRYREDQLIKSEEEARTTSKDYRTRLSEQKEILDKIEETIRENDQKYRAQLEKYVEENSDLKSELASYKERDNANKNRTEFFSREIENVKKEVDTKERIMNKLEETLSIKDRELKTYAENFDRLTVNNKDLLDKLEQANLTINSLENKLSVTRKKFEEEKTRIIEEKDQDLNQKREKTKILKDQIKDLEDLYNKLFEEKRSVNNELERLITERADAQRLNEKLSADLLESKQEIEILRKNLQDLKNQNDEIFKSFQNENQKAQELTSEFKKESSSLKRTEERLLLKEKDCKQLEENNKKLLDDLRVSKDEAAHSQQYISKLEGQLQYLQQKQNDEIAKVEIKLDKFAEEIHSVREENVALKTKEGQYLHELQNSNEERDRYRKEYKSLKQKNKILESEINELKIRVEQIILSKIQEADDLTREVQHQKEVDSKMKVLEDLQGMIRTHRAEITSSKSSTLVNSEKK